MNYRYAEGFVFPQKRLVSAERDRVAPLRMTVPPDSPREDETSRSDVTKQRRPEGWVLAIGALILVGLLGHLLNQQRIARQKPDVAERQPIPAPVPEARPADPPRRNDASTLKPKTTAPTRVTYMVTHKHRLRDCHGTLTFTRTGLRFDSDEPQDSFDVGRDDVVIDGDVVRIRDKSWRFEFNDDVRAAGLFSDWKAGTLPPVSAP